MKWKKELMSNKKNTVKKKKEKINKAKQILENSSKNVRFISFEKELENKEDNKIIEVGEALNQNASETSEIESYKDKKIQDISYLDLQKSFEKGFLYVKSLKRCQESVLPYKIYLMENTLYNVKDLDLEDEAFYIIGEGDLYIKILFDDKDILIKAEGI